MIRKVVVISREEWEYLKLLYTLVGAERIK